MNFQDSGVYCILIIILMPNGGRTTCMDKFKESEEYKNSSVTCLTNLELNSTDLPSDIVELVERKYDDKCFSKCVMELLNFFKEDGSINIEEVKALIKQHATEQFHDHLNEILKKCADSTEKYAKFDDGNDKNPCKYAAMFYHCFDEQERKVCV